MRLPSLRITLNHLKMWLGPQTIQTEVWQIGRNCIEWGRPSFPGTLLTHQTCEPAWWGNTNHCWTLFYYPHLQHGLKRHLNNFPLVFWQPIGLWTHCHARGVFMWWCMRLVCPGRGKNTSAKQCCNKATSALWVGERWSSVGTSADFLKLATSCLKSSLFYTTSPPSRLPSSSAVMHWRATGGGWPWLGYGSIPWVPWALALIC